MWHEELRREACPEKHEEKAADQKKTAEEEEEDEGEEEGGAVEQAPAAMDEEEYANIVNRMAKKLPALAAGGIQMAADPRKSVNLRSGMLKQRLARRVMMHGIARMEKEVTRDRESDPRASLALSDFWHIRNQFDASEPCGHIAVGSPQWKRLCRIMGFLRRNAAPA